MKTRSIVFFLVLTLTLALCSFNVCAEDVILTTAAPGEIADEVLSAPADETADEAGDTSVSPEEDVTGEDVSDETDGSVTDGETADDSTEADGETDGAADGETADDNAETDGTTEATDDTNNDDAEEKKGIGTGTIVFLAIIAVIIVVLVVLWFVKPSFRERIKRLVREYKSELKKVVWSSKADVISNTKLVVVIIVIVAVIVGLLDYGLGSLIELVGKVG